MYKERRLICFNILRTQVGNVFDQNETYDCVLIAAGLLAPAAWPVAAWPAAEAAARAPPMAPVVPDDEPLDDELAACDNIAALLTIWPAADRALAKLGLEPAEPGAKMAANGDEAAADMTLAKLIGLNGLGPDWPAGLVCT